MKIEDVGPWVEDRRSRFDYAKPKFGTNISVHPLLPITLFLWLCKALNFLLEDDSQLFPGLLWIYHLKIIWDQTKIPIKDPLNCPETFSKQSWKTIETNSNLPFIIHELPWKLSWHFLEVLITLNSMRDGRFNHHHPLLENCFFSDTELMIDQIPDTNLKHLFSYCKIKNFTDCWENFPFL